MKEMSVREAQQNHSSLTGAAARPRRGQIVPGQESKVYMIMGRNTTAMIKH